ncbi:LEAF RUST 10 DISEASE-RESISTANCE LOCUS RECEPTOR-LIKE PROTEIN KINASE-like 1.2 isoform X1 [Daucus carota subsp. sativus]|uniref:LEAF RUST 10 DISEASE-RESISTANCE LOCUS RECEPTOR-LIKE PROTEIN KINASE-like 1.2 isoform X1 n=1 Tax=Daucus carota subsp. sativus TaxID=79200 RepID=UPI0007EFE0C6|nr:PREDICTED: LEAF RUST 10 DISEASE-RESISTANCE LOCUS RECEPTOR-LIKE PROTEIN KINASE-like 1.2 isoform X1 [Daucus carota subsp. sativus]
MRAIYHCHIHVCLLISVISLFFNRCCCVDQQYEACVPRNCGSLSISFPFFIVGTQEAYCGSPGFNITCVNNTKPLLRIPDYNEALLVDEIFYDNRSLRVSNAALRSNEGSCGAVREIARNLSVRSDHFEYANDSRLVLLWDCSGIEPRLDRYRVGCDGISYLVMKGNDANLKGSTDACKTRAEAAVIDDEQIVTGSNYSTVMRRGFVLKWRATDCTECKLTQGRCGFDIEHDQFLCFCPDRPHYKNCTATPAATKVNGKRNSRVILPTGTAILGASFVLMICLFTIIWMYKGCGNIFTTFLSKKTSSDIDDDISYFGVPVFSYKDLEEATHKFDASKELGDGGYGTVYYGKLKDGREVAVKRLYENNFKRQEQFMNEIEILTRLRHRNLVLLYGCTSHRSHELLLVYEYIPNGTVADHLHGDRAENEPLTWHVRMHIALETASALAYLHKSDIIHRDVKTNNILLDKNFTVKVADFGLSRLFPTAATHVSTAPQGTPGYVDPEYHQCYQLTDKSDVYSFGVVLIELISSMPAVDISRSRNEINLANLAVNRIQKCAFDELIDPSLGYKSDPVIERMTTSVAELAFRCLQLEKELRPAMDEVYECLRQIQVVDESNKAKPQPSPESENVVLLKNKTCPASPVTVIDNWMSSRSTTPSVSEI